MSLGLTGAQGRAPPQREGQVRGGGPTGEAVLLPLLGQMSSSGGFSEGGVVDATGL